MRFARYEDRGHIRCGIVSRDGIHPLPEGSDLLDLLLLEDPAALAAAGAGALADPAGPAVDQVRLLPPIQPPTIRDFVTFEEHVEGVRRSVDGAAGVPEQWYAAPTFYFTNPYAVIGAHDEVPMPPGSTVLDFELEVAAVIGRAGRDLTPEQARDHIAGYTILNDWSARDLQREETVVRLGPAKGKDFASSIGPWLVTPDELASARAPGATGPAVTMTASVNGIETSRGRWSDAQFSFGAMVARASADARLRPGDLIGSGTVGTGCLLEVKDATLGRYLEPGDEVVLAVERLGTLRTPVIARPAGRR